MRGGETPTIVAITESPTHEVCAIGSLQLGETIQNPLGLGPDCIRIT